MLASGTQDRGFKPGRSRRMFRRKNPQHAFLRRVDMAAGRSDRLAWDDFFRDQGDPWESPYYNMKHKKRGKVIIFNHENFDNRKDDRLKGTKFDRDNLKKTMEGFGFEVKVHDDLTRDELMKTVDEASNSDHSDCDCFAMAVLSHGNKDEICARDSCYEKESLCAPFTASKCPTLAGKPKVFFLLACQGDKRDKGFELDGEIVGFRKIPDTADFLRIYSTAPGYISWRSNNGSPFVGALCSELKENGTSDDILAILTRVNARVAEDYDTGPSNDPSMHEMKQMPCFTSTLRKKLIFTRN